MFCGHRVVEIYIQVLARGIDWPTVRCMIGAVGAGRCPCSAEVVEVLHTRVDCDMMHVQLRVGRFLCSTEVVELLRKGVLQYRRYDLFCVEQELVVVFCSAQVAELLHREVGYDIHMYYAREVEMGRNVQPPRVQPNVLMPFVELFKYLLYYVDICDSLLHTLQCK